MYWRIWPNLVVIVLLALLAQAGLVKAHEIRPAIADLLISDDGNIAVELKLNLEAVVARIGPQHDNTQDAPQAAEYDALRKLPPDELRARFADFRPEFMSGISLETDQGPAPLEIAEVSVPEAGDLDFARDTVIRFSGTVPSGATELTWKWAEAFGASAVRVTNPDGSEGYAAFLQAGEASAPIPVSGGSSVTAWEVFRNYVAVGFEHIVPKGLDHILFVVGLFLLSPHLAPLLWQVTSFTIAHSITLALAMLGIVSASPSIVEPLIAASIVYVGLENVFTDHLQKWRPVVVFCFGLLHGLGFAGVLTEFGLSPTHFVAGLVAFNIGVELGQLAVIAACFLAVGLWFGNRVWYRRYISIPASLAIAAIAAVWFFERVGLMA